MLDYSKIYTKNELETLKDDDLSELAFEQEGRMYNRNVDDWFDWLNLMEVYVEHIENDSILKADMEEWIASYMEQMDYSEAYAIEDYNEQLKRAKSELIWLYVEHTQEGMSRLDIINRLINYIC